MNIKLVFASLLLVTTMTAAAKAPSPLPDWTGPWQVKGSVALISTEDGRMFVAGTRNHPPLKPQYEQEYAANLVRAEHQGDPDVTDGLIDSFTLHCFPGMPRLIATPAPYEFMVTAREVWIIADKAVRRIFTDGRDWPPDDSRWPLMMGRSKGHWEGKTLIIETVDMRDDMWLDTTPLTLSKKATLVERLRQTDANTLEDRITIRDPEKFVKDWNFTRYYLRSSTAEWPDDPELCGGPDDRNPIVNGRVTVQLPQDKN